MPVMVDESCLAQNPRYVADKALRRHHLPSIEPRATQVMESGESAKSSSGKGLVPNRNMERIQ